MNKFSQLFYLTGFLFIFSNSVQSQEFDGYALYNGFNSNTTYLIDKNGDIAKEGTFFEGKENGKFTFYYIC